MWGVRKAGGAAARTEQNASRGNLLPPDVASDGIGDEAKAKEAVCADGDEAEVDGERASVDWLSRAEEQPGSCCGRLERSGKADLAEDDRPLTRAEPMLISSSPQSSLPELLAPAAAEEWSGRARLRDSDLEKG